MAADGTNRIQLCVSIQPCVTVTILNCLCSSMRDCVPQVKELVSDQTKEYGDMTGREMNEEFELCKTHVRQQNELLRRLMDEAHAGQLRDLEARQEK